MNPNLFVAQVDVPVLLGTLTKFASREVTPQQRISVLTAAGVALPGLQTYSDPDAFALLLLAEFRRYCVSEQRLDYHPLLAFLDFLLLAPDKYGLDDDERRVIEEIATRAKENLRVLVMRRSVGRIETVRDTGIGEALGTGVLVGHDLLLTCWHVLTKTRVQRANVRFGYKRRCDANFIAPGTVFELELDNVVSRAAQPDYALLRIKGQADLPPVTLVNQVVDSDWTIRMIHYPAGEPIKVSEPGRILQSGTDYIDHTLPTAPGSSGAPIFDDHWELIAIHRGIPGIGRTITQGSTEGVPITAIWQDIQSFL